MATMAVDADEAGRLFRAVVDAMQKSLAEAGVHQPDKELFEALIALKLLLSPISYEDDGILCEDDGVVVLAPRHTKPE